MKAVCKAYLQQGDSSVRPTVFVLTLVLNFRRLFGVTALNAFGYIYDMDPDQAFSDKATMSIGPGLR